MKKNHGIINKLLEDNILLLFRFSVFYFISSTVLIISITCFFANKDILYNGSDLYCTSFVWSDHNNIANFLSCSIIKYWIWDNLLNNIFYILLSQLPLLIIYNFIVKYNKLNIKELLSKYLLISMNYLKICSFIIGITILIAISLYCWWLLMFWDGHREWCDYAGDGENYHILIDDVPCNLNIKLLWDYLIMLSGLIVPVLSSLIFIYIILNRFYSINIKKMNALK